MEGRKVLLIDDSELSLQVATDALTSDGFEVRAATQLAEFDRLLEGWQPDIILTDVNMPELSGAQLCKAIKARFKTHSVPVVLFSSLSESELERLARDCGADAYLSKSGGVDRLADELNNLCEAILW
jgi:CheY-like chemotaxis protein